jgi:hypothetical protein
MLGLDVNLHIFKNQLLDGTIRKVLDIVDFETRNRIRSDLKYNVHNIITENISDNIQTQLHDIEV